MALNTSKCNYLTPLHFERLIVAGLVTRCKILLRLSPKACVDLRSRRIGLIHFVAAWHQRHLYLALVLLGSVLFDL